MREANRTAARLGEGERTERKAYEGKPIDWKGTGDRGKVVGCGIVVVGWMRTRRAVDHHEEVGKVVDDD